ncbi:antibiotic biosynthesis monooxygenase [Streptomyces sp. 3214.6]|uniref:antibiotic biosynthesis monooxygenase n=1 Tax=Streptomyces sp. 3214.6 TaxID=1882757 RepID=UPI00090B64A9|nr:antibiotic biosynthesis monooxygenase [Streptomyces sp. 3214.6]SHH50813.1 Antibiotic biosynthesis monooxygenase [Streptomyces sp. 3214.6]
MTSADGTQEGFRTFLILRTDGPQASNKAVEGVEAEVADRIHRLDGFLSSRTHLGLDRDVVVHSVAWRDEASARDGYPAGLSETLLARLGRTVMLRTDLVGGTPSPGVRGPAAGRPPGLVCVAVRYVADHAAAQAMADLLRRSGDWKQDFPGFISATPYISADGRTYINYPQWADRGAFEAYMADRRNAAGQQDIGDLEVAPPDLLLCTLVAETAAAG